jgi:hypothetical protein
MPLAALHRHAGVCLECSPSWLNVPASFDQHVHCDPSLSLLSLLLSRGLSTVLMSPASCVSEHSIVCDGSLYAYIVTGPGYAFRHSVTVTCMDVDLS